MGLFSKLFGKKEIEKREEKVLTPQKSEQYLAMESFLKKLTEMLSNEKYIPKSEYRDFLSDNMKIFEHFSTIKNSDMLDAYCLKNSLNKNKIEEFIESYVNIELLIKKHNEEFVDSALIKESKYLDEILESIDKDITLDENQRRAVLTDEDYSLIIAGAGAGKTTTVAAKVKYLVDKQGVDPKQILVISFTNKAVDELRERINKGLGIDCPISTFHSAGNAILRKQSDEKLNIKEEAFMFNVINNYLKSKLLSPKTVSNLVMFFGTYFTAPYEGDDINEFFNSIIKSDFSTLKSNLNEFSKEIIEKREKKKTTITNEILSSIEEVQIANYLYINGIDYEYQPIYPYHITLSKKPYTPDFLITQGNKKIYLEHFGIHENGTSDRYSQEVLAEYKKAIEDKKAIHKKHGTALIYTYSKYINGTDLLEAVEQKIISQGLNIKPRSKEEILEKIVITEEDKYIFKLVKLLCRFINNFKTNGFNEDKFYYFLRQNQNVRTKIFLEIAKECYLQYQRKLLEENAVDFQDMINESTRALKEYEEIKDKLPPFKYIIVDEYQDISKQRFDLTKELARVTEAKIIAVGDDWQSIYAFSGSDVSLFTKFCEKMGYGVELKIVHTYRNAQEVIDIAGNFVQKNASQIRKALISPKHINDPVIIYSYDDSPKKSYEKDKKGPLQRLAEAIEVAIGQVVEQNKNRIPKNNPSVLLIGRYGFDGKNLEKSSLFDYQEYGNKIKCKKYPYVKIQFLTAHSSKGLGYDDVIIINASSGIYGFPCKIEDDPVLKFVTYEDKSIEYAEERRLFYVAMTRTKNRVYMIAPKEHPSEFVVELLQDYKNIVLDGELAPAPTKLIADKLCPVCGYPLQFKWNPSYGLRLYICTNEPEICNFISNDLRGGKMSIQKCSECVDGYLIVKPLKEGGMILGCTNYKYDGTGCGNTISYEAFMRDYQQTPNVECSPFELKQEIRVSKDNVSATENVDRIEESKKSEGLDVIGTKIASNYINEDKLEKREDNSPSRVGESWDDEEEDKLINAYKKGISISTLSIQHGRTEWGIRARLAKLGFADLAYQVPECYEGQQLEKEIKMDKVEIESTDDEDEGFENSTDGGMTGLALELRNYAKQQAGKQGIVFWKVLRRKVIQGIVKTMPRTLTELSSVYGIGEKKVKDYGNDIINIVNNYIDNQSKEQGCLDENEATTVLCNGFNVIVNSDGVILTDLLLLEKLRQERAKLAQKSSLPAYCIFSNDALVGMATYNPHSKNDFLSIKGIGEKTYQNYGEAFSYVINNHKK